MKIRKKVFVILTIVFFVGYAGGILTEHVVHNLQGHKSANTSAEEHSDHTGHCADGHMDEACSKQ